MRLTDLFEGIWQKEIDDDEFEELSDESERLLRHHDNNDTQWEVLKHGGNYHDATRPLMIIVHPGDMVNGEEFCWSQDNGEEMREWGFENLQGLGNEMYKWRNKGADIVVLHRGSCSQFGFTNSDTPDDFYVEVMFAWKQGTVLFGDDLDTAAEWIINNLHIAQRPKIFLGGAYSDFDHGCLTFIGREIEKIVGEDRIEVSYYTPADNYHSNEDGKENTQWRPGNRRVGQFTNDWRKHPGEPERQPVSFKVQFKGHGKVLTWTVPIEKASTSADAKSHIVDRNTKAKEAMENGYRFWRVRPVFE